MLVSKNGNFVASAGENKYKLPRCIKKPAEDLRQCFYVLYAVNYFDKKLHL